MLVFLSSCNADKTVPVITQHREFFDLKEYFRKEIKRLKSIEKVKKTIVYNGTTEEKEIFNPDFEQELDIFISKDINRVAWLDKYQVDTLHNAANHVSNVTYQALDTDLGTQRLSIGFQGNNVEKITILSNETSAISESSSTYIYEPKSGYSIESNQEVALLKGNAIKIIVRF